MKNRHLINKAIALALLVAVMNLTACGFFLYPERRGQTGGRLDPAVFLLDAAGLLIGIIPGVVAFAVDISTGAIYLPKGDKSVIDKHLESGHIQPISHLPVDKATLAAKLSHEMNRPVTSEMIQLYMVSAETRITLEAMEITVLN